MIRLPNRLAGMIPLRTHRHTVATDTSSSVATCFVVMYLFVIFVMLNLVAIYTRSESDVSDAASEFAATAVVAGVGTQDVSVFGNCFHLCFHFGPRLSRDVPMVSKDVSNVSIFSEEF